MILLKKYILAENTLPMGTRKSKKKEAILETARKLFWKHGVSRITTEEICDKANVSKMTYYKFFSNKKELAYTLVKAEISKNKEALNEIKASASPFTEKVKKLMDYKLKSTDNISNELLQDIFRNKGLGLHKLLEAETAKAKDLFAELIENARNKGEIKSSVSTAFVMHYIEHLGQMAGERSLLSKYNSMQDLIMDGLSLMFYGLEINKN